MRSSDFVRARPRAERPSAAAAASSSASDATPINDFLYLWPPAAPLATGGGAAVLQALASKLSGALAETPLPLGRHSRGRKESRGLAGHCKQSPAKDALTLGARCSCRGSETGEARRPPPPAASAAWELCAEAALSIVDMCDRAPALPEQDAGPWPNTMSLSVHPGAGADEAADVEGAVTGISGGTGAAAGRSEPGIKRPRPKPGGVPMKYISAMLLLCLWLSGSGLHTLCTAALVSWLAGPSGPAPASASASSKGRSSAMDDGPAAGVREAPLGFRLGIAFRVCETTEGFDVQPAVARAEGEVLAVSDLELLGDLPFEQQESWLESLRNEVARMPLRPPITAMSPAPATGIACHASARAFGDRFSAISKFDTCAS